MKKVNRLAAILPPALAAIIALTPLTGYAQDSTTTESADAAVVVDVANNTAFGDWVVTCEAITIRRNACRLVQEQSLRETGELVARFIALPVSDGVILLAQVPMGVYLPGGAIYRISGQEDLEQREMIWQRCAAEICEAAAPIDDEELALFAKADSILFGFRQTAEAEPVILKVDISKFTEAVQMIRDSAN